MNNELAVQTKNLCKSFAGKEVIRRCSISVEQGTIYGFLGKNGAGKTTVFKILLGFLRPDMGKAEVFGMDSQKDNLEILKQTGSLIETPVFYEHLSAADNLKLHLAYMGAENGAIGNVLTMVGLKDVGIQPVSTFSLGMRQRLAIARSLVHRPKLLILDEPVNGLDPIGIKEMRELFRKLVKEDKITILLSSHILSEIGLTADRIGIIVNGTVAEEISPREIEQKYPKGMEDYFIAMTNGGTQYE